MSDFLVAVERALRAFDPAEKVALTRFLTGAEVPPSAPAAVRLSAPGRPEKPVLVMPRDVPKRGLGTPEGRAALLHALAHIEFNAVNLALDAIYRFRDMPLAYYEDWLKVAQEEAYHFTLLREYLQELGFDYGDFPAHNGLWEMALRTDHDVLIRMALVPRVLEARGLDVTPGIQARMRDVGDTRAMDILAIILRDEIGHVQIGNRWYRWCCVQRGVEPVAHFIDLYREYVTPFGGPMNHPARIAAGFTQEELDLLASLST
ncbi:uncharacterized ferritin-like protein (DUF455 family) [Silvimonas terrae]|uniref:Uncharacterized ferritin-like protein (DUF455 family) n=1 Tax=Silvimonas terrae TaxID=300266 RepID=A0A840RBI7_9NEIS|nr:ferritin-like domain-containing protein [Silvimonas terrae]MBB5190287.1 uncharacterized ferritin-like protein (DUF455 family) [Silvimonas terrae]